MMRSFHTALAAALVLTALHAQAARLFRHPAPAEPLAIERALDCHDLEREIARLEPATYSYKPGFYQNPYQGAAMVTGTVITPILYLYSGYDYYRDYRENRRIIPAQEKIERLRRLKAEKRCFIN